MLGWEIEELLVDQASFQSANTQVVDCFTKMARTILSTDVKSQVKQRTLSKLNEESIDVSGVQIDE
jgi:hypothetical protein